MTRLSETEACGFEDLFADVQSRSGLIVTFLALLEMIRLKLVRVFQAGSVGPIRVYRRARPADAPHPLLDPEKRHAAELAAHAAEAATLATAADNTILAPEADGAADAPDDSVATAAADADGVATAANDAADTTEAALYDAPRADASATTAAAVDSAATNAPDGDSGATPAPDADGLPDGNGELTAAPGAAKQNPE
jgi:hypothetical protein